MKPKKPSEIQRYWLSGCCDSDCSCGSEMVQRDDGDYVKYADHALAVDQARREGWKQGMRDATEIISRGIAKPEIPGGVV